MKVFTTLLLIFLLNSISYSQNEYKTVLDIKPDSDIKFEFSLSDDLIPINFKKMDIPDKIKKNNSRILSGNDTLTEYFDRSTGFTNLGVNGVPLYGTNNISHFLGPRYNNASSIMIHGVLIAYSLKQILGRTDTLVVWIFNTNSSGAATGTNIGVGIFTTDDIVTNFDSLIFTTVMLNQPVKTSSNFACMVLTNNWGLPPQEQDRTWIFTNESGNGLGEQTTCVLVNLQQTGLTSFLYGNWMRQIANITDPDVDMMVLPLISSDVGVDDPITLDGLTIKSLFPNPVAEVSHINFAVDQPTNIKISLVDMNGRNVKDLLNKFVAAGNHNIELDFSDVQSGSYFYTIITNRTKFAGKINVVK